MDLDLAAALRSIEAAINGSLRPVRLQPENPDKQTVHRAEASADQITAMTLRAHPRLGPERGLARQHLPIGEGYDGHGLIVGKAEALA